MKLKRFEEDNNHLDYKREEKIQSINESKFELIANISKNWNDELSETYKSIRNIYKLNREELKSIQEQYILSEKVSEKPVIKENNNVEILDTVAELLMKYGDNEAVENIRIDEGKIVFDLLCDTDIEQSVTEYNGFELHYNKVCQIPVNEKKDCYEDKLLEQSIYMNSEMNRLFK